MVALRTRFTSFLLCLICALPSTYMLPGDRIKRQDIVFSALENRNAGNLGDNLGDSCRISTRTEGRCMPISQCRFIRRATRQNSCNSRNYIQSVCCPIDKISTKPTRTTITRTSTKPTTKPSIRPVRQSTTVKCGFSGDITPKVFGGTVASLNAWPWMAAIYDERFGVVDFNCGGTLINSNYILTAAHCVTNSAGVRPPDKFNVRLGELNLRSDNDGAKPVTYNVKRIIVHPEYTPSQPVLNDIALMELSQPVTFTEGISPICLPMQAHASQTFEDMRPTVIGWGKTETGKYSDELRQVSLPVTSLEKCKSTYFNYPIGPTHLCAGYLEGGKDSCKGDSGGPLMSPEIRDREPRWMIIGVVSVGAQCGQAALPGVYSRVTSYLDWIQNSVN